VCTVIPGTTHLRCPRTWWRYESSNCASLQTVYRRQAILSACCRQYVDFTSHYVTIVVSATTLQHSNRGHIVRVRCNELCALHTGRFVGRQIGPTKICRPTYRLTKRRYCCSFSMGLFTSADCRLMFLRSPDKRFCRPTQKNVGRQSADPVNTQVAQIRV